MALTVASDYLNIQRDVDMIEGSTDTPNWQFTAVEEFLMRQVSFSPEMFDRIQSDSDRGNAFFWSSYRDIYIIELTKAYPHLADQINSFYNHLLQSPENNISEHEVVIRLTRTIRDHFDITDF